MKPYPRSVFKMSMDARLLERGGSSVVNGVRRYFLHRVGSQALPIVALSQEQQ